MSPLKTKGLCNFTLEKNIFEPINHFLKSLTQSSEPKLTLAWKGYSSGGCFFYTQS